MYPRFLTQTMNLPASFRASLTFLLTEATCMSTALAGGVREVPPELVRNGRARDGLAAGAQKQPQDGGLVMRERHEPARRPKVLPFEGDRAPGKVEGAACAERTARARISSSSGSHGSRRKSAHPARKEERRELDGPQAITGTPGPASAAASEACVT